jgi:hypothetical protein
MVDKGVTYGLVLKLHIFSSLLKHSKFNLQNLCRFFYIRSILDATILTEITSKGAAKFELNSIQVDSFLVLLEF